MNKSEHIPLRAVVSSREVKMPINTATSDFDDVNYTVGEAEGSNISRQEIFVEIEETDSIDVVNIGEIKDSQGRISDILEACEEKTGLSVIPFEMCNIANEVKELQRHLIYEFNGKKYAMSRNIRKHHVQNIKTRIIKQLSNGLPFKESLMTTVFFGDKEYLTLELSKFEWTYVMSMFRNYKECLFIENDQIYLEILAERRQ